VLAAEVDLSALSTVGTFTEPAVRSTIAPVSEVRLPYKIELPVNLGASVGATSKSVVFIVPS
jgi:hypothetical protein